MKPIIKTFISEHIENGRRVFPCIIVTTSSHWDGKKSIRKVDLNFQVLGTKRGYSESYDFIIRKYPALFQTAENYADTQKLSFHKFILLEILRLENNPDWYGSEGEINNANFINEKSGLERSLKESHFDFYQRILETTKDQFVDCYSI